MTVASQAFSLLCHLCFFAIFASVFFRTPMVATVKALLQIHPSDNVAVALRPLSPGTFDGISISQPIPQAHKVAIKPIGKGQPIIKYGYPIGLASSDIKPGEHVHSHNITSHLRGDLQSIPYKPSTSLADSRDATRRASPLTFNGYLRPNGQAATRNEIWIVNTVGCVNRASELIANAATKELASSGIEGIYAFPHPFGCSQLGDDLTHTQKVLAGLVNHPNAAAVLVLGLGCENNQMKKFLDHVGPVDPNRIKFFNAQEVSDEVESGVNAIRELAEYASQFKRQPIDASKLILGMKCGGSDGFSGITANPLVGKVADRMSAAGGTVLLSEVPEMFGAEPVLLERADDKSVFDDTISLVNNFRDYFRKHNEPIDENPSPGNKDGGISTLAEKSLGCVQKGGHAPVKQILDYGQRATAGLGGLALVNAPGNDGVSSTAMTVAGAHLLCFTTGRGTPMGFPAPTIKISTNSDLAQRKPQWIDFDAGPIATGATDPDTLADNLLSFILQIASGQKAKNETHGYREIAIWKDGVTL
jgi:altronate hydrolase